MTNPSNISRGFKGIWIPAELWLDNRLTPEEKVFVAEVDSLDRGEDHCFASNEYFADFFQCKERKIQDMLSKLKKLGFIEQVSFDGRSRTIKSNLKTIYTKFSTSAAQKDELYKRNLAPLHNEISHPSSIGERIEPDNKEDNKDKEVVCPSGGVPPAESQKKVEKIGTDGNKRILEKDAVIHKMLHQMPGVTMGEIEEAWKILVGYSGAVNNPMQFILGTVKNLKSKRNLEKLKSKDKKCAPTSQMPPGKVLTPEEIASRQQHAQLLFSEYLTKP